MYWSVWPNVIDTPWNNPHLVLLGWSYPLSYQPVLTCWKEKYSWKNLRPTSQVIKYPLWLYTRGGWYRGYPLGRGYRINLDYNWWYPIQHQWYLVGMTDQTFDLTYSFWYIWTIRVYGRRPFVLESYIPYQWDNHLSVWRSSSDYRGDQILSNTTPSDNHCSEITTGWRKWGSLPWLNSKIDYYN